jgi:sigma-B regulation protein RsbU (phosphoserine phosphatase)
MNATEPASNTGIELRFRSCPTNLAAVRGCVESLAASAGFSEEWRFRIVLAVDEALANVIRHGYSGRTDGEIHLRASIPPAGGIRLEIEDQCPPIDPGSVRERDLEEVRPGGLGWPIIRDTFDRHEWRPKGDVGMYLLLERGPQPAGDSPSPAPESSP